MFKTDQQNFFTLDVYFYSLKFFGMASYTFCSKTTSLKIGIWNYLIFVSSLVSSGYVLISYLNEFTGETSESGVQSKFVDSLWKWQYIIQNLMIFFVIFFNFCQRKRIENFYKLINSFDEYLKNSNFKIKPQKNSWLKFYVIIFILMFLCLITVFLIYALCFSDFESNNNIFIKALKITVFQLTNQFFMVLSLQFVLSVHCVCAKFKVLRNNIR